MTNEYSIREHEVNYLLIETHDYSFNWLPFNPLVTLCNSILIVER